MQLSRCEQFGGWKKELSKFDDKCFCVGRSYDRKMSHFFHVVESTRTVVKWTKTKNARARRAKLQILTAYICKLMTFFSIAVVVAWALFMNLQYFLAVLPLLGQHFIKPNLIKRISILLFLHFDRLRKAFYHSMEKINEFNFFHLRNALSYSTWLRGNRVVLFLQERFLGRVHFIAVGEWHLWIKAVSITLEQWPL